MVDALVWGVIQGLTEFLPISSSGHLVLGPAFLSELGVSISTPSLAQSAFLHLGTLVAVVVYYRQDLRELLRFRTSAEARRLVGLLAVGTAPAAVGLVLEGWLDTVAGQPGSVSAALLITAAVLWLGDRFRGGERRLPEAGWRDGLFVGVAQALALVPGISRSAVTITAGMARGLSPRQATRFSFLLSVPAIAAASLRSATRMDLTPQSLGPSLLGLAVAAVVGYVSIIALLALIGRVGLRPFAFYATALGVVGLVIF